MSIRVSIVVPVYNSQATLPKCLDSLIAQTYQDLEIICINDKSTDNSLDIIKDYKQHDHRVVIIDHKENRNAGGARNSGIRAATGTYICFVDNDDWLAPDAIEILIRESDDGKIDFVVPKWCEYYNEDHKIIKNNLIVGATKEENCNEALLHGCRILGCLIRREIFFDNDLFYPEKTFFEDNAVGMGLIMSANDIKVVDKVLYYYQMVDGSSSRTISIVKIKDRVITSDLCVKNLDRLGYVNDKNRLLVNYCCLHFSYITIQLLAKLGDSEAMEQMRIVAEKIRMMMPNRIVNEQDFAFRITLKHPFLCYPIWRMVIVMKNMLPARFVERIKHRK